MDRYVPLSQKATPKTPTAAQYREAAQRATPIVKETINPFQFPEFPPKAKPPKGAKLAMDDNTALCNVNSWAFASIATAFNEGLQWLGYPYLAQLAQRPEYRVITETIAGEMTRKWITFEAVGEEEDKTERIKQLNERFEQLEVKDNFRIIAEQDGYFGRAHLYLDTGDTDDRDELSKPLGDGQNEFSLAKVGPGRPLRRLSTVEAVWAYPTTYDSINPLKPDWYNPQQWYVMGQQIHVSRLLRFVGREVPDLLKPAYSFGGLSLSQIAKPYVDNWLTTRQSVNDLIHSFVVWGLKTNLGESLQMGGEQLFQRVELFNRLRDNRGCMLTDKDTEEFFNVTAPLGTLDALQAQAQEHMASVSRIPLVKLLGIQPAGLNASSEGEIRVFYDTIAEYQEKFFRKNLTRVMHFVMLSLWGEIDKKITFKFEKLWALDEKQESEVRKTDAETGAILVEGGVIDQAEERKRVAEDPSTPYAGLDKNKMPDLLREEQHGLVPEGGGRVTAELEQEDDPSGERSEHPSGEEDEGQDADLDESESDRTTPIRRIDKLARLITDIPRKPHPERSARLGKLKKLLPEAAE